MIFSVVTEEKGEGDDEDDGSPRNSKVRKRAFVNGTNAGRTVPETASAVARRKLSVPAYLAAPAATLTTTATTSTTAGSSSRKQSRLLQVLGTSNEDQISKTSRSTNSSSSRTRRFSSVGMDTVSRKLSTTVVMMWRANVGDVVNQARGLGSQYVRSRLRREGLLQHRKVGAEIRRIRSMATLTASATPSASSSQAPPHLCEVFGKLQAVGHELESLHPKLYSGICKQVAVTITSEKAVRGVLGSVAEDLLRPEDTLTWSKVVGLFCVSGGLAVDCVRGGHPEHLLGLVEALSLVIERDAASWIANQGGWTALLNHHRPLHDDDEEALQTITIRVACLVAVLAGMVFFLRLLGSFVFG